MEVFRFILPLVLVVTVVVLPVVQGNSKETTEPTTTTSTTPKSVSTSPKLHTSVQTKKPPMIWQTWGAFGCQVDTIQHPDDSLQQSVIQDVIDRLVADGYVAAGYNYVQVDNCWQETQRNSSDDRLVPDRYRFSNISELVEYGKENNISMGIFECLYEKSGDYPGTFSSGHDHTAIDTETFVEWNFEMIKICGSTRQVKNFMAYRRTLNLAAKAKSKNNPLFYCKLAERIDEQIMNDLGSVCNMWNAGGNTGNDPASIWATIDDFGKNNRKYREYHTANSWITAPPLMIGDTKLTMQQAQTQMAFWCLWSVPLIINTDIRTLDPDYQEILLNTELIEINQDPLNDMGIMVKNHNHQQVWVKALNKKDSFVVLYFNNRTEPGVSRMQFRLNILFSEARLEFNTAKQYKVEDLFHPKNSFTISGSSALDLQVHNQGSVRIVKLTGSP